MSLIHGEADEASGATASGSVGVSPLVLEECSLHNCEAQHLDAEMTGGMGQKQSIPVQLMLMRRVLGGDTVGVKRR